MARILITSGPTRQYLDPVRFLTNASSGRMGQALAHAALEVGHQVHIVSGPVEISYPAGAEVTHVVSTRDMLEACQGLLEACQGLIGVAAPCDFQPASVSNHKIRKTGQPLLLELEETPDVLATLGSQKRGRWLVGFALETEDGRARALRKLHRKHCDLMVLNGPEAMRGMETRVELVDRSGAWFGPFQGGKLDVAREILAIIQRSLIDVPRAC